MSRWTTLIQSFRLAIYHLSTLPTEPLLHLAIYAGLASLKLPACYSHETRNVDCPVCNADLGQLAKEVPFSHHVNSTIVCRLTGNIMDADNMPLAFPSGQVYSKEVRARSYSWFIILVVYTLLMGMFRLWKRWLHGTTGMSPTQGTPMEAGAAWANCGRCSSRDAPSCMTTQCAIMVCTSIQTGFWDFPLSA